MQQALFRSETITGTVERITFYNEENGYTVAKITPEKRIPGVEARDGTVAVVGIMPELGTGESVRFTGYWIDDAKYGRQFRAETCTPILPTTEAGIVSYLSSGIVKGIGERTAQRIVDHFGSQTLDILDHEPERLGEVLKPDLARKLANAWVENQGQRQAMIFLQGYGVTSKMATRIYKFYGFSTVDQVKDNPYTLADEVNGIGFIRADDIARKMGVPLDAPHRIRAGLIYALGQLAKDGHTYALRPQLLKLTGELLKLTPPEDEQEDAAPSLTIAPLPISHLLETILISETAKGQIIRDDRVHDGEQALYLPEYYDAESEAAAALRALASGDSPIREAVEDTQWGQFLPRLAAKANVELTAQQQGAVRAALEQKVSVLTGGPGTGKTTTLKLVIDALRELKFVFALASPTGRAAKRLGEATGESAQTIHRLLGFLPGEGFAHDEDDPLKIDMLVVDEASMVDLLLFHDLLRALRPQTHLLLVGDVDQLPSVGAGNVLRDVIDSGVAHVTRLDAIFRQSEDSQIISNAHRINQGQAPQTDNKSSDFFFFSAEEPDAAGDLLVDIVVNRLPSKFGLDPLEQVQVIAPMYRGAIGVQMLNERLQQMLNGDKRRAEKQLGGKRFRVGDKVMQTKNNYEREVFNGDIGRVYGIDFEDGLIEVMIDGRPVFYEFTEAAEELILAYCISTHRSQGSEYPCVVMPVMTQHYMMLQRNLLYTAVTRAKQMVVLVGSRRAVHIAVSNNKVSARNSGLLARLRR